MLGAKRKVGHRWKYPRVGKLFTKLVYKLFYVTWRKASGEGMCRKVSSSFIFLAVVGGSESWGSYAMRPEHLEEA